MNREKGINAGTKRGCGNQSNSASWSAAYMEGYDKYVAMLSFSSAYGCWEALYEITENSFVKLGSFENDDYQSERLIRKGRLLYRYENERNYPEPTEIVADPDYEVFRQMLING